MPRFAKPSSHILKAALCAGSAFTLIATAAHAYNGDPGYFTYDGGTLRLGPNDLPVGPFGGFSSVGVGTELLSLTSLSPTLGLNFDGISQVDVRALHSNFSEIPPDTMGAIGATQFMETSNGAYAVYDKTTGLQTKILADGIFWAQAGQPASDGPQDFSNGDSRVLFDKQSGRWIVESLGASLETIQIAVSDTSDATGGWKSAVFTGFAAGGNGLADYPTLAIDHKAVYIGTNDFDLSTGNFDGTTLNVIGRSDLFGPGGPKATDLKQFFTPISAIIGGADPGFAIQGVNQVNGKDNGKVIAVSIQTDDLIRYDISNPGTAGATQGPTTYLGTNPYIANSPGRQPDGSQVIDTLDDRISSAAWEQHGMIYAVHTVTAPGSVHTEVVWTISDAATSTLLHEGAIADPNFDIYQGAIAVNAAGQVVISYNRSGFDAATGNVSVLANTYNPNGVTGLKETGSLLLHVSPIDDYHNGSPQFSPPVGRQRWGDFAQVTVDPNNRQDFWMIGEYALGYLPNPNTSFSRWGTWISEITLAQVPEPSTWAMMLLGFGLVGGAVRHRKAALASA
jgi:PEP-CTERM motif